MPSKSIAFYTLSVLLHGCWASKCVVPVLRDHVQDNGKNECEAVAKDCRTAPFTTCHTARDKPGGKELAIFQIISIAMLSFLLPLVVIATITDVIYKYTSRECSEKTTPDFWNSLTTWSLFKNSKSLLQSEGGRFPFLNGIRVLCAYWVLLGHTFAFPVALDIETGRTINLIKEMRKSNAWTPIENFTFSVDTFFFISGFLLFHSAWKLLKRDNGKMNIPLFLFHKYWRLMKGTVVLLICTTMFYLLRSEVCFSSIMLPFKEACDRCLWRNLLCINNYWPSMEICGPHTWFIAVLFQFHIVGIFLVHLIYRKRNIAIAAGMILVIVCNAITYFILTCYIQRFEHAEKNERFYLMLREYCRIIVYTLPFDHFGPYWFGMVTGWMVQNYRYSVVKKKLEWSVWVSSVICLVAAVFSCHLQNTINYHFMYEPLHRTTWGIGLVWIVYKCAIGNGGILNKFLSWRPFLVLGELSYQFYLIHPLVVLKDSCQHKGNFPFQVPYWICRSIRTTAISISITFFFHVVFERPILKWKMTV